MQLEDISKQIAELIIGQPANKNKFCEHIEKVIRELEKHRQYLLEQWQKAKEAGWLFCDEGKDRKEWTWLFDAYGDIGRHTYFTEDERWNKKELSVQFYIKGKPEPNPLSPLECMIAPCIGEGYKGLELSDYQFTLLAIIHDAQNWLMGRERIYFPFVPHTQETQTTTLADRFCKAVWEHLVKSYQRNPYEFRDVQQTIETALLAVKADLASTKQTVANQQKNVIVTGGNTMVWDVFVCHASEDKKDFVRPLAEALTHAGLNVWYDDFSLKTGDSLRQAIDKGLGHSQFGIVVISQSFLKKDWPQKELDGLDAREVNGKKVILPIWRDIGVDAVRKCSPTLAGRKAISSALPLGQIVKQLLVDMEVKPKRKVGIDTLHGGTWGGLTNLLGDNEFELTRVNSKIDDESLMPIKALIIATKGANSDKGFEESEIDAIQRFVTSGGALLCVDLAWSWVYPQYGNKPIEQFPLNVLGKKIGFCITGKNINLPTHFSTEIMVGINTIKRDEWVPSEIEFYGPKSQSFIMDDEDRVIAGIMPVGEGLVAVVGHRDLLKENPEITIRILAYFAREKQWTARR